MFNHYSFPPLLSNFLFKMPPDYKPDVLRSCKLELRTKPRFRCDLRELWFSMCELGNSTVRLPKLQRCSQAAFPESVPIYSQLKVIQVLLVQF